MKAFETAEKVKNGTLSAVQAVQTSLKIIKEKNAELNAFIEVWEQEALSRAEEIDKKRASGKPLGLLAGVPVGIKDNMLYKGHIAAAASKMLANHTAAESAFIVERMLEEDAIIIGRLNMDEFAMGSSNETSYYGPVKNPVDITRSPGGSSGGSAAAVAAGMVPLALGSDTGGSVRQPAAWCGVVGLKPTYGRISRRGVIAFSSSTDTLGVLSSDIKDAALLLQAIAGRDEKDSTSLPMPVPKYTANLEGGVNGLRVGIPTDFLKDLNAEMKDLFLEQVDILKKLGAEIKEIKLPLAAYSVPCYYIITGAEAASNFARYDGIKYGYSAQTADSLDAFYSATRAGGFGKEVKKRVMIGYYVLGHDMYEKCYQKARKVRDVIKKDFTEAFKEIDIIATPTASSTAAKLGSAYSGEADNVSSYLADLYTCPANMAGLPAVSVPCGFIDGLPAGLQFIAAVNNEEKLLKTALAFENRNKKEVNI